MNNHKNCNSQKMILVVVLMIIGMLSAIAQAVKVQSPNGKVELSLYHGNEGWYLSVSSKQQGKTTELIPSIGLGLVRNDQAFAKELQLLRMGKPVLISEEYQAVHGKRSARSNAASEVVVSFTNPGKSKLNLIMRAYNDGFAFRYEFPEKQGEYLINEELTTYSIPLNTIRWMEKWNPANEGYYTAMSGDKVKKQEWSYPALFLTSDSSCWFLLHEADLDRNYCGSKLNNSLDSTKYALSFPHPGDGRGKGASAPSITLPWKSPWRLAITGSLQDIVSSTLVEDVSAPSVIKHTDWIKPGLVSWNYWSDNHGTQDYKTVCAFADLAADMNWPYTLLDWEWDAMRNGGNMEDAAKYILSKGVKPLIWYNSGGDHT